MKKSYIIILLMAVIATACGSSRLQTTHNPVATAAELPAGFPQMEGFVPHVISVPSMKEKANEALFQVEIIPGKTMEVDCNNHLLSGEMDERQTEGGERYYVFLSDGKVASTLMGCPDNRLRKTFVQGRGMTVDYNSAVPTVIYTPEGMDVKQRIWEAGPEYPVSRTFNSLADSEATKALRNAYPEELEGYERYVLILPEVKEESKARRVEIITGLTKELDCNRHRLVGELIEESIEGWGYSFFVFVSEGGYTSTRMGCPDNTLTPQFITGETRTIDYNSRLPLVVFAPTDKQFEVRYRVWEAPLLD